MLEAVKIVVLIFCGLSLLSLALGLIRPVWVLWFLDRFNRLMVIKVYGKVSLGLMILWGLLEIFG
ncbi:MAG: hypothetical protein B7Z16_03430 [Algoriphagus sp. 32-45-6]|nr:MAG: hypothetical protein B7Z16_03430 [Algoriphagus sp. 32-45-6]